ncbi:hypothetical protein [Enterobacter hormaechei]|uniref:hypothetical protein n=1 Tax=Enterobacter hormaechei TaxID=158836 RepID=UPI000AE37956|nr:hypothetical protein [Enterobacter hormaechei]
MLMHFTSIYRKPKGKMVVINSNRNDIPVGTGTLPWRSNAIPIVMKPSVEPEKA